MSGTSLHDKAPWSDESFGLTLLTPTIIYVRDCMKLASIVDVKVRLDTCGGAPGTNGTALLEPTRPYYCPLGCRALCT